MSKLFKLFPAGTVFNPLKLKIAGRIKPIYNSVSIKYPSRLNAMAIDPSKIASNKNMVFTPGEVVFPVKIFRKVEVKIFKRDRQKFIVSKKSKRESLILHSAYLMKKALKFKETLFIDVDNSNELRHSGLGSSSALIASVASAINKLYGNPISKQDLVKYLAQNHGEEVDGKNNMIQQVQCIGGSSSAGIIGGGLIVIAGESQIIKTMKIQGSYDVIIGIPSDYKPLDSEKLMEEEEKNLDKFKKTGQKYGSKIAYKMLHEVLPGMNRGDLKPMGDLIFDYRFKMGSINNCSFVYPDMVEVGKNLSYLKENEIVEVLSLSSVGPAYFAITKNSEKVISAFEKEGLVVQKTKIENNGYKVYEKKKIS